MAQADEVALETMDVQEEVQIETERATPRKRRGRQRRAQVEKRHPATSQRRTRQQRTVGRAQQWAPSGSKKRAAKGQAETQHPRKRRRPSKRKVPEPPDIDDADHVAELAPEPSTSKKGMRLLKKDIEAICKSLVQIDPVEMVQKTRAIVEADTTHLEAFPDREKLWKHVSESEALTDIVKQLTVGYAKVYQTHSKGKDKYSHFLVAWHNLLSCFAVEGSGPEEEVWRAMVEDAEDCWSAEDRSAIMTSIAKAVYDLMEKATHDQLHEKRTGPTQRHAKATYPQAKESLPDDDASIVRVSGFALHSAIRYRKRP